MNARPNSGRRVEPLPFAEDVDAWDAEEEGGAEQPLAVLRCACARLNDRSSRNAGRWCC